MSNLPLLSKLLERVVQVRLQAFLDINRLIPTAQSAYRKYHGRGPATAKVFNDLLLATDRGQVSALCLFDLTAAFDTVDYHCCYGVSCVNTAYVESLLGGFSRTYRACTV